MLVIEHLSEPRSADAGSRSTSSLASEQYTTAESTIDSRPNSIHSSQDDSLSPPQPPSLRGAVKTASEPDCIESTLPILKLPSVSSTDDVVDSASPIQPRHATSPDGPHKIPPSPTLSTRSSVRFATSVNLRDNIRTERGGLSSLGLLPVGRNTHRRQASMSSSLEWSVSDRTEDAHRDVPNRFGRPQFGASQVSTLATRTHVDEPEEIQGEMQQVQPVGVVEIHVTAPSGEEVSALAKFRRGGKLAGRARRIIQRIWKVKTDVQINAANKAISDDAAEPPHAIVTPHAKVLPTDDDIKPRDMGKELDMLRDEINRLRARLAQAECVNQTTREELEDWKNKDADVDSEQGHYSALETVPISSNQELVDRVHQLEAALVAERRARDVEIRKLHQIFRESLIGS